MTWKKLGPSEEWAEGLDVWGNGELTVGFWPDHPTLGEDQERDRALDEIADVWRSNSLRLAPAAPGSPFNYYWSHGGFIYPRPPLCGTLCSRERPPEYYE